MAKKEKYSTAELLEAIKKGHTPAGAAAVLKCHSDTIRNYARRYPTVREALQKEREELVDYAESGLRAALLSREAWAIAFTLKTLGRDMGYSEKYNLEVEANIATPITFEIVMKDEKKD